MLQLRAKSSCWHPGEAQRSTPDTTEASQTLIRSVCQEIQAGTVYQSGVSKSKDNTGGCNSEGFTFTSFCKLLSLNFSKIPQRILIPHKLHIWPAKNKKINAQSSRDLLHTFENNIISSVISDSNLMLTCD